MSVDRRVYMTRSRFELYYLSANERQGTRLDCRLVSLRHPYVSSTLRTTIPGLVVRRHVSSRFDTRKCPEGDRDPFSSRFLGLTRRSEFNRFRSGSCGTGWWGYSGREL